MARMANNGEVPHGLAQQRSQQLNALTSGAYQRPTIEMALREECFPFTEGAALMQPPLERGIVHFENIHVGASRNEILAILGMHAPILTEREEPVHIIIDRITGKTLDAWVEFVNPRAAHLMFEKWQRLQADEGRILKMGDRHINYRISNQGEMMMALFPNAKGVRWVRAVPHVIRDSEVPENQPWLKFKGFFSVEEMEVLARHADMAHSSHLIHCPQRPFEVMISILLKAPWYASDYITIVQRHAVYSATERMIGSLKRKMQYTTCPTQLNQRLLDRLVRAAMNCPGFSVSQKDSIAYIGSVPDPRLVDYNMPPYANLWTHTWTLVPKPRVPSDLLQWYIAIIRETTNEMVKIQSAEYQAKCHRESSNAPKYWGYYYKALDFSSMVGSQFDNMSLKEVANREINAIETILGYAFGSGRERQQQPPYPQNQQQPGMMAPQELGMAVPGGGDVQNAGLSQPTYSTADLLAMLERQISQGEQMSRLQRANDGQQQPSNRGHGSDQFGPASQ